MWLVLVSFEDFTIILAVSQCSDWSSIIECWLPLSPRISAISGIIVFEEILFCSSNQFNSIMKTCSFTNVSIQPIESRKRFKGNY